MRGSSWLRIRAVARRHAYVLLRSPHRLFDVVLWPLVDVLLFGSLGVFVSRQGSGGAVAFGYLLTGIVLWHVVYQAQIALSTGFLEETWSRNLLNLLVTPLREGEYAAGVVLFGLAKLAIGVTVVGLVALGLFAFNITDIGLALVPIVALLLVVGWSVGMIVIGLILRVGQGAEILAWGLLAMLMPLSGIFYPVSALPGVLQPIGRVLPLTHIFAAARAVLDGHALPWDELAIAAVGALVLAVASVWFVVRMLAVFRARGYISRYV